LKRSVFQSKPGANCFSANKTSYLVSWLVLNKSRKEHAKEAKKNQGSIFPNKSSKGKPIIKGKRRTFTHKMVYPKLWCCSRILETISIGRCDV
jgi:hypothetical protein